MAVTNSNYREMVQDALQQKEGIASFNDIKTHIFTNYHVKRGFANWVEHILKQMVEKGEVKQTDADEYSLNKLRSSAKKTTLEVCGLRRRRKWRSKRRSKSRRRRRLSKRRSKSRGRSRSKRSRRRRFRSGSKKGKKRSASRAKRRRALRAGRLRKRFSRRGKRSGLKRYRKRKSSKKRYSRKRLGACCSANVSKKNMTPVTERKAAKMAEKKIKICTKAQ